MGMLEVSVRGWRGDFDRRRSGKGEGDRRWVQAGDGGSVASRPGWGLSVF